MNVRALESIIVISEEKNLSRAAERLFVSQPALSQQLKKLEKELDAPLFLRERNQLVLTDAGKIYINGARSALSIYSRALKEIGQLRLAGRRQISLVQNSLVLPGFSTRVLPAFAEQHPGILLNVMTGNAAVSKDYLLNGMADLAVFPTAEPSHSLLEYFPLRTDELLLVLPDRHPLSESFAAGKARLADLASQPFILNRSGSYFLSHERKLLAAAHITPHVLCEISDPDAARHMVADGKGAAFLPRSLAGKNDGCSYFPLDPPAMFHIVIACHKSTSLAGPVRDLILLLLRLYGEQ